MRLAVTPEEAGQRVDLILAHRTGLPRSAIAAAAKNHALLVNGAPVRGSRIAGEGDVIDCEPPEVVELVAESEAIDLAIVYEDDDIIVVDKPAGMTTHPARGATSGTLVNALLGHLGSLPVSEGDSPSAARLPAGLVHRLDRDTSGLLLVAKTPDALTFLGKAMKARHIEREYLGLVIGIPVHEKGTIDGAIGRDPHNRLKFAITSDGKPAITHYEIRERLHNAAELLFRLETGRTHQIRVHMAALGYPLINDPVYGNTDRRFELPGQALHAWRLEFMHPHTHEMMRFEVAPPPEYVAAKEILSGASQPPVSS